MSAATDEAVGVTDEAPVGEASDLESSIEQAIDEVVEESAEEEPDEDEEQEESAEDDAEGSGSLSAEDPAKPEADSSPPEPAVDDGLIERAVKAGVPLTEAKKYTDPSLLESMVSRLEGVGEAGSQVGASEETSEGTPPAPDDLLSAIPDLDPNEYDEKIVNAFAAMKGMFRQQQEVIAALQKGNRQDWFDVKMEPLKGVTNGDVSKTAAVRDKFDVLKAGYKAAGREVADDSVFDEAAKLVLGDAMSQAQMDAKAKAAKKRRSQHLKRSGAHRAAVKDDPMDEIAAELDRKFFAT